jgi:LysR family transcriptional regulator for metE and metH
VFLELRHLRTLSVIRDCGSVALAAERLHLTQSALSHQVKSIEDYFEMPLFVRKSRPLVFTPAGQRILELAEQVLPATGAAERDLRRLAGGQAGRLFIAIECHSCFEWLMPTLDTFRENWPEVEMDILTGVSFDPLPALVRREVDLVVTSDPIEELPIHYEPLFRYRGMLAVAKDHPLARRDHIEPADLSSETLIAYPVEHGRLDVFKYFLAPAGIEPAAVRTTELTAMIMQLVASKRGVSALPSWVLTEYLERDYVAARPLGAEPLWCTLYAAIRQDDADFPYMRDFMELARETSFGRLHGIRAVSAGAGQ